jgi:hypothetical protein
MSLKDKLAAAMNRAKQSPMDGGDKKKKNSNKKPSTPIYLPLNKVGKISTNTSTGLSGVNTASSPSAPAQKTKADYKAERYAARQEFKTKKQAARQETKLDRIKSGESGRVLKAAEGAAGVAGTVLGLAETAKRIFKKNNSGE